MKVNESADLVTTVSKQFREYCEHLTLSKEGADAMLKALKKINEYSRAKMDLIDCRESAEKTVQSGSWTQASVDIVLDAIANADKFISYELADADDLTAAKERLEKAVADLEPLKTKSLKVTPLKKTIKASLLRKKAKTVRVLTVKGAEGKVKYKKISVNKKGSSFKVNKKTGMLTVKKNTAKGLYKIRIRAAAGNGAKTVTVKVRVK